MIRSLSSPSAHRPRKPEYPRLSSGSHAAIPMSATAYTDLRHFTARGLIRHPPLTLRSPSRSLESLPLLQLADEGVVRSVGFGEAVYHILCVMVGAGVLGLPSTLVATHWYGLVPLAAMAVVLTLSAHCLTWCALKDPTILTYRDLGEKAFGLGGQITVLVCQVVNCVGPAILFLILMGDNLRALSPGGLTPIQASLLAGSCALPFCYFRTFGDVGLISLAGVLASMAAIACVAASIHFHDLQTHRLPKVDATLAGFVLATARASFAYGGHAVFPGILRAMREPADFSAALTTAFATVALVYVSFSALCYHTFGSGTRDNVLLNLPPDGLRAAALLMVTAHVGVAVCLYLNPLFYLIEETLGIETPSGAQQDGPQIAGRVAVRTALVACLVAVALFVPFFGPVMDLVGGTVYLTMGLILPLACYWRLQTDRSHRLQRCCMGAAIAFAVALGAVSTAFSVAAISGANAAQPPS